MNLAIVSTNETKYSETFILNHVNHLPCKVHYLFDGYLPNHYYNSKNKARKFLVHYPKFLNYILKKKKPIHYYIERYLIKHKIDAILCEYGPSGVELMPIAKKLNLPLVVHFHGYDAYRTDILNSYGMYYPDVFLYAKSIIAVSKHMYNQLSKLGCSSHKLKYLPYGIDDTIFRLRSDTKHNKIIVSCGRFVPKKGPQQTILSFSKVHKKIPDARLIMIGDGELLAECKLLVQQLKIENYVEFTGALNQTQIANIYHKANLFVQHSLITKDNDMEGTPLAILEAMSTGLPVIATKHGGINDIIEDGVTGFLIEEQDTNEMAKKMELLLLNEDLAKQMGQNASAFVSKNHTLASYTKTLYQIINE